MTQVQTLIRGGTIATATEVFPGAIAIQGGKISAVIRDGALPDALETIDASGLHVLPGFIDCHVHLRSPGYEYKEDWRTGTAAAAAGGVTTLLEMPNTVPSTRDRETLRIKQELAKAGAMVDYGIYALIAEDNLEELEPLSQSGICGFKCYMGTTFGHLPAPSDGLLLDALGIIAPTGLRVAVHAENTSIMVRRETQLRQQGANDIRAHLASRPAVCEAEAVGRAITLAEWAGCKLHIAHVTSADALPLIRAAKERGVDVTAETCPHYLLLTSEDAEKGGNAMRVNPPIRDSKHAPALWCGIEDGVIDMISTDHSPHAAAEKTANDIWATASGFPGLETLVPLMLNQVVKGRLGLKRAVELTSLNPAKAWGLAPRKGALETGADADIVIVDLQANYTIRGEQMETKGKITPFEGRPVGARVTQTLVRGVSVGRDGRAVGEAGFGQPARSCRLK